MKKILRGGLLAACALALLGWPKATKAQEAARGKPGETGHTARRTGAGLAGSAQAGTGAQAARAAGRQADDETARLRKQVQELKKKLQEIEDRQDEEEIARLKLEGQLEALQPPKEEFRLKSFMGHARALQGLNPELSLTGDLAAVVVFSDGKEYTEEERTGFRFRVLGLHFQSALDPFSFMKAALEFSPEGAEFGEAYIVWTDVGGFMNIMAGKFRQQLGVVNRWHKHALDQYDFPLMLTEPFGEGGLNQIGVSLEFLLPKLWADALQLVVQVTNGMNGKAFAGEYFSLPTTLVHLKNYWDLSRNTYLELGLTGIAGFNNKRGVPTVSGLFTDQEARQPFQLYDDQGNPVELPFAPTAGTADESIRVTAFAGADLTILWEPVNKAKYRNFLWRTEFLYGYQQRPSGHENVHWMGGYTYVQAKVSRSIHLGARLDFVQPFAEGNDHHYVYQVSPYLVWWQSPWARIRVEYEYLDGDLLPATHRGIVQVVFAAGPHKHERY